MGTPVPLMLLSSPYAHARTARRRLGAPADVRLARDPGRFGGAFHAIHPYAAPTVDADRRGRGFCQYPERGALPAPADRWLPEVEALVETAEVKEFSVMGRSSTKPSPTPGRARSSTSSTQPTTSSPSAASSCPRRAGGYHASCTSSSSVRNSRQEDMAHHRGQPHHRHHSAP